MFGSGKSKPRVDTLTVQVYAVSGNEIFALAQRIWSENSRGMLVDERTGKEFMHFAYENPKCTAWLQRDQGRTDTFELIVRWDAEQAHEVFTLTPGQTAGNEKRLSALLNSMLTTPSVVSTVER